MSAKMKRQLRFLAPTPGKRKLFFLCGDLLIFTFALLLAFNLRFDFSFPQPYRQQFPRFLIIFVTVKFFTFSLFKLYDITWRFVSLNEIWNICKATFLAFIACGTILYFGHQQQFFVPMPRSVLLIDFFLTLIFSVLVRGSKRIYLEKIIHRNGNSSASKAVIIGAGRAGEQLARDLNRRNRELPYHPVAFLDDDQRKIGSLIHGIRVEGNLRKSYASMKYELLQSPGIKNVSLTTHSPTGIYNNGQDWDWEGREPNINPLVTYFGADPDFLETFQMEIAEGESFRKGTENSGSNVLINERFAEIMNLDNIIGARLSQEGLTLQVIGVVKDFHFTPLNREIGPLLLYHNPQMREYNYMFIRLKPGDIPEALAAIEKAAKKFNPGFPFDGVGEKFMVFGNGQCVFFLQKFFPLRDFSRKFLVQYQGASIVGPAGCD